MHDVREIIILKNPGNLLLPHQQRIVKIIDATEDNGHIRENFGAIFYHKIQGRIV